MKKLITCMVVCVLSGGAFADTWTVDDDGKADFNNIQDAIDASSDGDEIVVYPGTYTSTQDGHVVNMLGKAVTLRSSDPSDPNVVAATIIDGENTRRGLACFNEETSKTIISGFTITNGFSVEFDYNGDGDIDFWEDHGGGMYNYSNSSPTLTDCTFTDNSADDGGGMFNYSSSPTLENCTFENNTATTTIYYGGYGGGMYNYINSSPTLTNCTFTGNTANFGGGMRNYYLSSPTLTDCMFTGNTANYGGGMYNYNSNPTLDDCTFTNNTAYNGGGGMLNMDGSPTLTSCIFENNSANYGGGMYNIYNNPTLTGTTVCGNTPDQIYGDWIDNGGNTIADECPPDCPDINGDGYVNVTDLLSVIDQWGLTNSPADINFDGIVDVSDLFIVVDNWGPCE